MFFCSLLASPPVRSSLNVCEQVGVDKYFQISLAKSLRENDSIGGVKRPIRYRRHFHLEHGIAFLSDNLLYGDSLQASANRWALQDEEG